MSDAAFSNTGSLRLMFADTPPPLDLLSGIYRAYMEDPVKYIPGMSVASLVTKTSSASGRYLDVIEIDDEDDASFGDVKDSSGLEEGEIAGDEFRLPMWTRRNETSSVPGRTRDDACERSRPAPRVNHPQRTRTNQSMRSSSSESNVKPGYYKSTDRQQYDREYLPPTHNERTSNRYPPSYDASGYPQPSRYQQSNSRHRDEPPPRVMPPPPNRGPHRTPPGYPSQGPPSQGPPSQGPPSQGPPGQGPPGQGPPGYRNNKPPRSPMPSPEEAMKRLRELKLTVAQRDSAYKEQKEQDKIIDPSIVQKRMQMNAGRGGHRRR